MASLTSKLETLASTASSSGDTTRLAAALAQTEARLDTTGQELAGLRTQLDSLGQARAAAPAKGTAMILAVLQMRDALRGAEPFQLRSIADRKSRIADRQSLAPEWLDHDGVTLKKRNQHPVSPAVIADVCRSLHVADDDFEGASGRAAVHGLRIPTRNQEIATR